MGKYVINPLGPTFDAVGSGSGGPAIGATVAGANPESVLITDSSSALQDVGTMEDGELVIGSTGNSPVKATLTGTSNQVTVTNGSGSVTLSLPQDISTTSGVQFDSTTVNVVTTATELPNVNSHDLTVSTSDTTGAASSGALTLLTGQPQNGASGNIGVYTGQSAGSASGFVDIATGIGASSPSGGIFLTTGDAALNTGSIVLATGASSGGTQGKLDIQIPITDFNGNKIQDVADPILAQDAATKNYIDTTFVALTEKGANNGVATLDAGGKVPSSQLPNSVMEYKGNWNASTNTPTLADGTGNAGDVYRVDVAGTQNLGSGPITFAVGDWAVYNGSIWEKSINSNAVVSVNGQSGIVTLDTDDISEGATNLYYQDTRVSTYLDGAISTVLTTDLTASRAVVTTSGGKLTDSATTSTEIGYVSGVTSAIQTQIDGKANTALSNLASTAVNTNLLPDVSVTRNIGTTLNYWNRIYSNITNTNTLETVTGTGSISFADPLQSSSGAVIDMNNGAKVINVVDPTNPQDAATKNYVDTTAVLANPGDIPPTSFSGPENQVIPNDINDFVFSNAVVRCFSALVSIYIDADTKLYETLTIHGIQKETLWEISVDSTGDDSGIELLITTSGQMQYTAPGYVGFNSLTINFRAISLPV